MKSVLKAVAIFCICLIFGYCIRGLWIKAIIIEKKARLLSEFLDQSFSRLGITPEDISRQFHEEKRVGVRKFVHTTRIFNLPQDVTQDLFYQAILEAIENSKTHLLEKTNFEIGDYSISIFALGRRPVSTHLIVGIKKKILKEFQEDVEAVGEKKKDRVAIIIDDLGYNRKAIDYIKQINVPLTLAVLPKLPFSGELAQKGNEMGHEIILHLPLEPEKEVEALGPGAIFLEMSPEEIENILDEDLKTVPHCCGMNNHTGSKFTKDAEKMKILLKLVKRKNLFFIDSLVTPHSLGFKLARELDIPTASRDVFLDNIKKEEDILKQLKVLIGMSRKNGSAIGIGHPSPVTFKVLKENLSFFESSVEFVYVSELLK